MNSDLILDLGLEFISGQIYFGKLKRNTMEEMKSMLEFIESVSLVMDKYSIAKVEGGYEQVLVFNVF